MGMMKTSMARVLWIWNYNKHHTDMTTQQIQNAIGLCKGEPVSKIMQLFALGMWRQPEVDAMAKHFNCPNTKQAVAERLHLGF